MATFVWATTLVVLVAVTGEPPPAVMFPAGGTPFVTDEGDYGTTGWEFEPTPDIKVTELGYYDDQQDGLLHPRGEHI